MKIQLIGFVVFFGFLDVGLSEELKALTFFVKRIREIAQIKTEVHYQEGNPRKTAQIEKLNRELSDQRVNLSASERKKLSEELLQFYTMTETEAQADLEKLKNVSKNGLTGDQLIVETKKVTRQRYYLLLCMKLAETEIRTLGVK